MHYFLFFQVVKFYKSFHVQLLCTVLYSAQLYLLFEAAHFKIKMKFISYLPDCQYNNGTHRVLYCFWVQLLFFTDTVDRLGGR